MANVYFALVNVWKTKNIHSSEWEIIGNLSNEYCESEKNSHLRHFKC